MRTQTITFKVNRWKSTITAALLLFACLSTQAIWAQEDLRTVHGIVQTLDGPIPGATIVLKGTTIGVISNDQGTFVFPKQLKENDVLLVSYLGYHDAEVTIGRETFFIEPFLKDDPVILVGALRMVDASKKEGL